MACTFCRSDMICRISIEQRHGLSILMIILLELFEKGGRCSIWPGFANHDVQCPWRHRSIVTWRRTGRLRAEADTNMVTTMQLSVPGLIQSLTHDPRTVALDDSPAQLFAMKPISHVWGAGGSKWLHADFDLSTMSPMKLVVLLSCCPVSVLR